MTPSNLSEQAAGSALPEPDDSPAAIRQRHLNAERSVRAIGKMSLLLAASYFVAGLWSLGRVLFHAAPGGELIRAAITVVPCVACILAGRALASLRPNSRNWSLGLMFIAALCGGFGISPIPVVIGLYIAIALLFVSPKEVFSPAYRDVVAATPEWDAAARKTVRDRSGDRAAWWGIGLAVLVGFALAALVAALMASH